MSGCTSFNVQYLNSTNSSVTHCIVWLCDINALHCIAVHCTASSAIAMWLVRPTAVRQVMQAQQRKQDPPTCGHPSPGETANCPGKWPLESDAPGPQAARQIDLRMHCPDQTGWAEATGFSVSASHRCAVASVSTC